MKKNLKISEFTFIGMTCALVMSIRNIPDVAATGWTMLSFMLIAVIFYALPISMIAGEYSGMYPGETGGMEAWNSNALSSKWGFVTSWLLWVQMFPGMVMISSALSPLIAIVVGKPELGQNNMFTFVTIIIVYWFVTLLNFKFDMAKIGGQIGVWLGVYIPMIAMLLLGIVATIKVGLMPNSVLGQFEAAKLIPDTADLKVFQYLAPIMFIFTGIEMSAVHANRLKDPVKGFFKGLMIALVFIFILNIGNAIMVSNIVPAGKMELDNIAQSIALYCKVLGIPTIMVNIFSLMVIMGVLVQLSAWSVGPSMTITSSARRGLYPPKFNFWKTNSHGISTSVVLTQAVIISIFAGFYLLIPGVNNAFLMLVNATSVLYSTAYVIMAIGIIELREKSPDLDRPFSLGSNTRAKFIVGVLLFAIVGSIILTLVYSSMYNAIAVIVISLVLFTIPFIINKQVKPEWKTKVDQYLSNAK
ncbi:MAG: amino acid permease [Chloroflexi bacterium]|nr:MAG: amino acid permease [Chloroflexota bacterium]